MLAPQLSEPDSIIPPLTVCEMRYALSKMDSGKAPGLDGISVKVFNAGGHCLSRQWRRN